MRAEFWSRRGDTIAWPFCVGLLALICINVGFQYGVNVWNRGLFDAIEQRNAPTVYYLGTFFPLLVIGSVGIVTSQVYVVTNRIAVVDAMTFRIRGMAAISLTASMSLSRLSIRTQEC